MPSLQWKSVWVKVSCRNPNQIGGTSEVFINKKGRKITWYFSDKFQKHPPTKLDDDLDDDEDDIIDEEDPESQESQGWLETGKPPPGASNQNDGSGPSNYQSKQAAMGDVDQDADVTDKIKVSNQDNIHDC